MSTDPALYALYQENPRLREPLTLVAQGLERLAAEEPEWRLLRRAMRIRRHLHDQAGRYGAFALN
jgi:hypothetical protein